MKPKLILGVLAIIVLIVFAGINLKKSLTPYVSLQEAKVSNSVVQFKGVRIEGSARYDPESKEFLFRLADERGDECQVVYKGVKPSNFEQAKEVVAIGRYVDERFEADQLLVKCPSKYQAEEATL